MMTINHLEIPFAPGVHQVTLDGDSAQMLRGLSAAWNSRTVVSQHRIVSPEMHEYPEHRGIVAYDLVVMLQDALARSQRTALWVDGPGWHLAENAVIRGLVQPEDLAPLPMPVGFWVCVVRALCVPMAAWDGATWAPR